jgi:hypothetical protein
MLGMPCTVPSFHSLRRKLRAGTLNIWVLLNVIVSGIAEKKKSRASGQSLVFLNAWL